MEKKKYFDLQKVSVVLRLSQLKNDIKKLIKENFVSFEKRDIIHAFVEYIQSAEYYFYNIMEGNYPQA